jgi:DICT domain-containing protein
MSRNEYNLSLPLDFSLYALIDRTSVHNIFMDTAQMLAHWCKLIEQKIIDQAVPATVYAGFQEFEHFNRVLPRYHAIVSVGASVVVIGEADAPIAKVAGITPVAIDSDHAIRDEWFVIVNDPRYVHALIARETTPRDTPRKQRLYQGVLTSDTVLIAEVEGALRDALGASN